MKLYPTLEDANRRVAQTVRARSWFWCRIFIGVMLVEIVLGYILSDGPSIPTIGLEAAAALAIWLPFLQTSVRMRRGVYGATELEAERLATAIAKLQSEYGVQGPMSMPDKLERTARQIEGYTNKTNPS